MYHDAKPRRGLTFFAAMLTILFALQALAPSAAWAQAQPAPEDTSYVARRIAPKAGQLHVITGPAASSVLGLSEGGYRLQVLKSQGTWLTLNRLTLHAQAGILDSLMVGVGLEGLFGQYSNINEPQLSLQYTPRDTGDAQFGVRVSYKPAIWNEDTDTLSLAMPARWRFSPNWALDTAAQLNLELGADIVSAHAHVRLSHALNDKSFMGLESELMFAGSFSSTHLPLWAFFGYSVHHTAQRLIDLTVSAGLPGGYYFFRETPLRWRNFTVNVGVVASFGELW